MLRLAGFSSGWRDCARRGCSAERCGSRAGSVFVLCRSCGSIGMFYVRLMPVMRSCWNVVCSFAPIIRSYRDVLCSITPAVCRIAPNRTACDMFRSYSAVGRDRHSCVLGLPCGYRTWLVHFGLVRFFMAIPTGNEETRERGERSRRRGRVRFCVNILALPCFPRGVRWG